MVMLAVNVTLSPAHIVVPGLALMLMVGVTGAFTTIVSVLLFTVVILGQVALLISMQYTGFPFARDDEL